MSEDQKVDRRGFIVGASSAIVGAAVAPGIADADQRARSAAPAPQTFSSPAGSTIPFSQPDLLASGGVRSFTGAQLGEIAFPIGGIGTGTVSLGGRGEFRDWEIFNRPNKNKSLPFTFVAIWAKRADGTPMVKVVEAPLRPPFRGGDGVPRSGAQGLPRFTGATFKGAYPFAEIAFEDDSLPVAVTLEAFNPLVPLQVDDSALPVAIFRYHLTNRTAAPADVALAFSILNAIGYDGRTSLDSNQFAGFGRNITTLRREPQLVGLDMRSDKYETDDIRFGSMALVTAFPDVSARTAWEGGSWWDSFQKWVDEYAQGGRVADSHASEPTPDGQSNYATLAPRMTLAPKETRSVEFILSWHFPLRENYWNREVEVHGRKLRNHYGTAFKDAWDCASYTARNFSRLERSTRDFQRGLMSSTLPSAVLDAVSSQMSIIRTNTCLLLEGRQFFAFEGNNDDSGCCPMNCTHVWNYEQALAHLFPELERSMRTTDFTINLQDDGAMAFRTLLPTGRARWKFKPAADGQMGCVMKLYREWQLSGDDGFLRTLWPSAKKALEYAWKYWDADQDGVMEGEQHNTYDIEFYGANTMMGTLYLGALLAGERMARAVGDSTAAEKYHTVFESGRQKLDRELWANGFYVQHVPDVKDIRTLDVANQEAWHASAMEAGGVKYQYGDGCLSDQLLGQWFAAVVGLGHLLPAEHVRETLLSIYRYNFKHNFMDHANTQRIYALNDEKGLLLCSWPRGNRPALPFVYSDEVWTGIEYQVAAHLIYEGLVMEGLAITKGVRDRYDGQRRNPWNEVECGNHYARALSSWSLLTALSGYRYSAPDRRLAFEPRLNADDFRCFFTTGGSWGTFRQRTSRQEALASIELSGGSLSLREIGLRLDLPDTASVTATMSGRTLGVSRAAEGGVTFSQPVDIREGETLQVRIGPIAAPRR